MISEWPCVFVIGTSAGGVSALRELLGALDDRLVTPIIIVQHLPDVKSVEASTIYFSGARQIVEIEDKMPIETNHVYFSTGGYHVLFARDGSFCLTQDDPVRYSRPSIDLCFESASAVFGQKLRAILLTGANSDGAEGLVSVRDKGGVCIVQDPDDADFPEMPRSALLVQEADYVVKLNELPVLMLKLQGGGP